MEFKWNDERDILEPKLLCFDDSLSFFQYSLRSSEFNFTQTINLIDPISLKRIILPCRGLFCDHIQCFDFFTFKELNAGKLPYEYMCPVCNRYTNPFRIYIDFIYFCILNISDFKNVSNVYINNSGVISKTPTSQNKEIIIIDIEGDPSETLQTENEAAFSILELPNAYQILAKDIIDKNKNVTFRYYQLREKIIQDVVHFVNNLSIDELSNILNLSKKILQRLISSRPFYSSSLQGLCHSLQIIESISTFKSKDIVSKLVNYSLNLFKSLDPKFVVKSDKVSLSQFLINQLNQIEPKPHLQIYEGKKEDSILKNIKSKDPSKNKIFNEKFISDASPVIAEIEPIMEESNSLSSKLKEEDILFQTLLPQFHSITWQKPSPCRHKLSEDGIMNIRFSRMNQKKTKSSEKDKELIALACDVIKKETETTNNDDINHAASSFLDRNNLIDNSHPTQFVADVQDNNLDNFLEKNQTLSKNTNEVSLEIKNGVVSPGTAFVEYEPISSALAPSNIREQNQLVDAFHRPIEQTKASNSLPPMVSPSNFNQGIKEIDTSHSKKIRFINSTSQKRPHSNGIVPGKYYVSEQQVVSLSQSQSPDSSDFRRNSSTINNSSRPLSNEFRTQESRFRSNGYRIPSYTFSGSNFKNNTERGCPFDYNIKRGKRWHQSSANIDYSLKKRPSNSPSSIYSGRNNGHAAPFLQNRVYPKKQFRPANQNFRTPPPPPPPTTPLSRSPLPPTKPPLDPPFSQLHDNTHSSEIHLNNSTQAIPSGHEEVSRGRSHDSSGSFMDLMIDQFVSN